MHGNSQVANVVLSAEVGHYLTSLMTSKARNKVCTTVKIMEQLMQNNIMPINLYDFSWLQYLAFLWCILWIPGHKSSKCLLQTHKTLHLTVLSNTTTSRYGTCSKFSTCTCFCWVKTIFILHSWLGLSKAPNCWHCLSLWLFYIVGEMISEWQAGRKFDRQTCCSEW